MDSGDTEEFPACGRTGSRSFPEVARSGGVRAHGDRTGGTAWLSAASPAAPVSANFSWDPASFHRPVPPHCDPLNP